jgi:hypothetical protein
VLYLRNLNHSRHIVVRTQGAPTGRLILPGATTALAIDPIILTDQQIQRRLAETRLAVLDRAGWCADLRQRRAADLDWAALMRQAEQRECDRLRGNAGIRRSYQSSGKPRKRRTNEWPAERVAQLRQRWAEGATLAAIAAELGVSPGAVGAQVHRWQLPSRYKPRSNDRARPCQT